MQSNNNKTFGQNRVGKAIKATLPLLAMMGGGAVASTRNQSSSFSGRRLKIPAAVYVAKVDESHADVDTGQIKNRSQHVAGKSGRSAFAAFTNKSRSKTQGPAKIITEDKALAFLKDNQYLTIGKAKKAQLSGNTIGRKTFSHTLSAGTSIISTCPQVASILNLSWVGGAAACVLTYTAAGTATVTGLGACQVKHDACETPANNAPTIAGAPASITVTEDVATDVNLSAVTFADADNDSLTVTLTANAGTLAATSGGSVTVGGSGTGTMTLAGTAANLNTFLDTTTNVKYTTATNDNTIRNISVQANDGTVSSTISNITVNITANNDDPSNSGTLPTDVAVTEDVAGNFDISGVTLADLDAGTSSVVMTHTASTGTLAATTGGSVTIGGSGTGTLTMTGSIANIDTYLNTASNIQYTGASNINGDNAATIAVKINDGGNTGTGGGTDVALGTVNMDITAIGDTPSVTGASSNEDTQTTAGLVISKNGVDGAEVTHYKITSITGGSLFKNDGTTAIANNAFITAVEGAAGLKFTPTANSSTNGSFDVQAGTDNAGTGLSAGSSTATITITAVNDAPVFAGVTNVGPSFAKGSSTQVQLDTNASISDTELDVSDDFSGATLTFVRNGGVNTEDVMTVQTAGSLTVAGGNVSSGGNVIATIDSSTSGQIVITFANNGTAPTGALVDEVLQNVTYLNSNSVNPNVTVRIDYAFSDGNSGSQGTGGALSDTDDFVNVTIANAPAFTNLNGGTTFTEGGSVVVLDSDASVADVEFDALNTANGDWNGASFTLRRNGGVNAEDSLTVQTGGGVTISGTNIQAGGLTIATFDIVSTAGELVISFTNSGTTPTTALVQDVLNNITYSNSSDTPSTSITLDVIANDGAYANTGTATVNITATNDVPAFTGVDAVPAFTEDGAAVVLDANAVIADIELDAANSYSGATLQLQRNGAANAGDTFANSGTLTALTEGGTFNVGGLTLGTVTTNSGGTLLLTFGSNGTSADVDSVIQQITYANANNAPAANVQVNYSFSDGNTGAQGTGGAGVDSNDSITVSITTANDAPSFAGLDATPIFNSGSSPVVLDSNATFVDPELDAADSYDGATLTLARNGGASVDDVFSKTGALSTLLQGNTFNVGGAAIGTVTTNSAGTLLLTFNAASTASDVDAVLQSIAYSNSNGSPPASVLIDYTVNDGTTVAQGAGGAMSGNGSINVTIQTNVAPVITQSSPQAILVSEDGSTSIILNATDVNSDTLTWAISSAASKGTATTSGTGVSKSVSYTPTANVNGSDSFVVQVSDGNGGTDSLTVNVTINAVNDAPTGSVTISGIAKEGEGLTATNNLADIDGLGSITYEWKRGVTTIGTSSSYTIVEADVDSTITVTASYTDQGSTLEQVTSEATAPIEGLNDAPLADDQSVTTQEDTAKTITLVATDPDDDNLTYKIESSPANGSLTGEAPNLVYTPDADFNGDDSFTFTANDGDLDSEQATISISITPVNDAPIAADDTVTRTDWDSFDIDVLANDSDVDGDPLTIIGAVGASGVSNVSFTETTLTYTPNNGFVGEVTIEYTIEDNRGATDSARVLVNVEVLEEDLPVISPSFDVEVNASGLDTKVELGVATAVDKDGNSIAVTLVRDDTYFSPGRHSVLWRATDSEGRTAEKSQLVLVKPQVSIDKSQKVMEGFSASVKVYLNGTSPTYPLVIPYSILHGSSTSTLPDHDLGSGELTIESGLEGSINFEVKSDSESDDGETLVIELDNSNNRGSQYIHTTTINEQTVAPRVSLSVKQNNEDRITVSQQGGAVEVSTLITHPDPNNTYNYDWTNRERLLTDDDADESSYTFDPLGVDPGIYHLTVNVTDADALSLTGESSVTISIVEAFPILSTTDDANGNGVSDAKDGLGSINGIPKFQDRNRPNALQHTAAVPDLGSTAPPPGAGFFMQSRASVNLRIGEFAQSRNTSGVFIPTNPGTGRKMNSSKHVASSKLVNQTNAAVADDLVLDPDAISTGGVIDFIAYDLPEVGESYLFSIPQLKPIPADAVYRKFATGQGWYTFNESASDQLFSAPGAEGYCPPPGDDEWRSGLNEGDWCVQLLIRDGGPNDADGIENAIIVDPGGVAVLNNDNTFPVATDDSAQTRLNSAITVDVLANDSDADGDTITISSAAANFGQVSIVDNQLFYQPLDQHLGVDTISYGISDGAGGTDNANVAVQIQQNQAPVANPDTATVTQGEVVIIDVLANDSDIEGDNIIVISASASEGDVTINNDNTISYSATSTFEGLDTISYTIEDTFGAQASSEVAVTVEAKRNSGGSIGLVVLLLLAMRLTWTRFIYYRNIR